MLVELRSGGVEVRDMASHSDRTGATLHYPAECAAWLDLPPGISVEDAEQRCIARRVATLKIAGERASVCADFMGMRHLYVHERVEDGDSRVTISDDPFTFAGVLPPDLDVLRLVATLKFAPLPLSCVQGATRIGPGVRREWTLRPVRAVEERSFLAELIAPDAAVVDIAAVLEEIAEDEPAPVEPAHVFLSGGMDSALLTYLLRRKGLEVQAWTARFASGLGRLESERAVASGRFLGARVEVVDVDDSGRQALAAVLEHMREPFADVATVAEAALAVHASARGARVAFEGEGVDSLMCGSYKFVVERYRPWLRFVTALVPDLALRGANRKEWTGRARLKMSQLKALARAPGGAFERHLQFLVAPRQWEDVGLELRRRVTESFRRYYDLFPRLDTMNRLAAMTFWGNIPNLENRKLDVVERHAGIRFALPFQDIRFIRAALSTRSDQKVRRGYGKWSMRRAYRGALPPHTLTRKKLSFVPPVLDLLGPEHEDVLRDETLFAGQAADAMLRAHRQGKSDHLSTLWAMFIANAWLRRYQRESERRRKGRVA